MSSRPRPSDIYNCHRGASTDLGYGIRIGSSRLWIAGGGRASQLAKTGLFPAGSCATVLAMPDASEVTLAPVARELCARFSVSEDDLREARANAWALYEHDGWLACRGRLPSGGREVVMFCRSGSPATIETFRVA